ncbi:MAG: FMN-binding protein [Spirochaetes bacterium]|nr:FMN-binding protein [Spirochaetota bacterium]MBU1080567.1 FMN-binding protein [Spirochaetota bacterium]
MPDIPVTTPSFAGLADGAYKGFYDGGMVKAEVEVTIAGGSMTSVKILRHECGTGKPAEVIVDDVVAAQNLGVDAVSGSTYSSKVILKAIEVALTEGLSR